MTTRHCCSTGLSILLCIALVAGADPGGRIMPDDLVYRGAFRLPDGPDEHAWGWSGQAMAYCPTGDTKGGDDGHTCPPAARRSQGPGGLQRSTEGPAARPAGR